MEQSSLAYWWYGDDESSFLASTGRNIITFTLGGVFGATALSLVKKGINSINDPSGSKRLEKAKKKAVQLQSHIAEDIAVTPLLTRSAL